MTWSLFSLLSVSVLFSDGACGEKSVLTACQNFQRILETGRQWIGKAGKNQPHNRYGMIY